MTITPLMPVYGRCEVAPVRGEGCYLYDAEGREWLDMASGIAVNCLWPRTTIATAAIEFNFPEAILRASRKPAIVADAVYQILTRDSRSCSWQFFIDEDVLREAGVSDFGHYAVSPGTPLYNDLFLG